MGIMSASMAASVRVEAPSKVNLHLRVYGRRPDGFHGILSLFQAISLSDGIVVRSLTQPDIIEIEGDFDCPPEATTVHKAVLAYRRATGERGGVAIAVDKRVPAGGGLGGGSGDAAATLRALDALFGTRLGCEDLVVAGAAIGSDVPFFFTGGAALVTGRGERVAPVEGRGDLWLALAQPGFGVGTARAYALLDQARPEDSLEPDPGPAELEAAYRGDPSAWPFANSFEPVVGDRHPAIPRLRAMLLERGAAFAAMSGSGSTTFGVFLDEVSCRAACASIERAGFRCPAASALARLPDLN